VLCFSCSKRRAAIVMSSNSRALILDRVPIRVVVELIVRLCADIGIVCMNATALVRVFVVSVVVTPIVASALVRSRLRLRFICVCPSACSFSPISCVCVLSSRCTRHRCARPLSFFDTCLPRVFSSRSCSPCCRRRRSFLLEHLRGLASCCCSAIKSACSGCVSSPSRLASLCCTVVSCVVQVYRTHLL